MSVSNASNMYTDTDSDTYATLTSTRAATTAYYAFINGFNFDSVPANARITGFRVKIKGRQTGLSTGHFPCLSTSVSSTIPDTTPESTFGSEETIIEIPTGTLTWQDLVNYGDLFSIRVSVTRAKANTQGYLYIYGAEIEVTYESATPSGPDGVYVKQNGLWVPASKILVKQSGVWNEASKVLAKDNGTWK